MAFATGTVGTRGRCCESKFRGDWLAGTEESTRPYNILHLSQPYNSNSRRIRPPTIHSVLNGKKTGHLSNIAVIRSAFGTQPLSCGGTELLLMTSLNFDPVIATRAGYSTRHSKLPNPKYRGTALTNRRI